MSNPEARHVVSDGHIDAVRRFNRFHTRLVGALGERLLASDYPLPQVRVLYEIANAPATDRLAASQLVRTLGLDAGYLSRLIAGLESDGMIQRTPSAKNAKRMALDLTTKGRRQFTKMNAASAQEVRRLLSGLTPAEQAELVLAMARIRHLLGDRPTDASIVLREPVPGDLGWIVHRQGLLYAREYGWDQSFEALVAEIVGKFGKEFVAGKERCWVAESAGEVVGSVFIVRQDDSTAKLRLLYVDASIRGQGLGRRLVDECIEFARRAGYRRLVLWTNDVLIAARRIYQAAGFSLVEEEPHRSFGKDLVGQVWALDL